MSDYPEVVYWLTLINQSGLKLNLIKPIIQRWCVAEQRALADLFDLSPLEWSTTFGLNDTEAEQAVAAQKKVAQQAQALNQWQAAGLHPLIRTDARYPKRFVQAMPPAQQPLILWTQGTTALLNEAGVTMVGNEAPDEDTSQFLDELMAALVSEDIGLVSGYGRGLDRATFETMLKTEGGRAVVVLPMGITAFTKTTSRLKEALDTEKIVLVSPFAPNTPFQERLAEARNLLIDYLALSLLILNPNEEAQTRARAALNRGLPVFVSLSNTSSNRTLIEQGALLMTDAGEVVEMVQQAVIDATLQESNNDAETEPVAPGTALSATPQPTTSSDPNDDFSLRSEEVEPLDSEEALEILSLGGEIPPMLRQRLEEKDQEGED